MSVQSLDILLTEAREHFSQALAAQREFSDWLIHAKSRSPAEVAERCIAALKKGEPIGRRAAPSLQTIQQMC
jgi:hypothetical protein